MGHGRGGEGRHGAPRLRSFEKTVTLLTARAPAHPQDKWQEHSPKQEHHRAGLSPGGASPPSVQKCTQALSQVWLRGDPSSCQMDKPWDIRRTEQPRAFRKEKKSPNVGKWHLGIGSPMAAVTVGQEPDLLPCGLPWSPGRRAWDRAQAAWTVHTQDVHARPGDPTDFSHVSLSPSLSLGFLTSKAKTSSRCGDGYSCAPRRCCVTPEMKGPG